MQINNIQGIESMRNYPRIKLHTAIDEFEYHLNYAAEEWELNYPSLVEKCEEGDSKAIKGFLKWMLFENIKLQSQLERAIGLSENI